jgi:ABC-type transport system involved in Fe-S cluster assembly fused permease/ATPase subunit
MADYDNDETPPVGEEIHLPGPSILPLAVGIAVTMIVIGTTLGWWLSIIGLIVFIVTVGIWIRDTRRDIEDLPEDHHAH